jgi:hypothetical protein
MNSSRSLCQLSCVLFYIYFFFFQKEGTENLKEFNSTEVHPIKKSCDILYVSKNVRPRKTKASKLRQKHRPRFT